MGSAHDVVERSQPDGSVAAVQKRNVLAVKVGVADEDAEGDDFQQLNDRSAPLRKDTGDLAKRWAAIGLVLLSWTPGHDRKRLARVLLVESLRRSSGILGAVKPPRHQDRCVAES